MRSAAAMTATAGRGAATHAAASRTLAAFVPRAGRRYARARNFDYGPDRRDNVSVLSPYLRHRLILEEEVLAAVFDRHSLNDAQKFVEELFWRTYFKGWLEHRPEVWQHYLRELAAAVRHLHDDRRACERYNEAVSGNTGIDCFDAWANELAETGYLHNHARMWFASIWVYTLKLPWQLGADLFIRHLLDGDPASNTLGWRWVCGLHTRGKTYLARVSNIANFTNYRFNPQGRLATSAPPLPEDLSLGPKTPSPADPEPAGRFGVLLTEEDCSVERGLIAGRAAAVLGLTATRDRSVLPVSTLVYDFAREAVSDALARANETWGCPVEQGGDEDWVKQTQAWATRHRLHTVVAAWAPVGPVATRLDTLSARLAEAGIELLRVRRGFDSAAWPHAGQGYFKLKRRIPAVLLAAGLNVQLKERIAQSVPAGFRIAPA